MKMKLELDAEIQGEVPLPQELTHDKALEIKQFAQEKTAEAMSKCCEKGLSESMFEIVAK